MSFLTPSLTTLQQQALSDITTANLPTNSGSLLRTAILRILSYVQAGLAFGHYQFLQWIAKQSVPFTSEQEYLEAWAALKGVLRVPATASSGNTTFTGTSGVAIPLGTVLSRADGTQYKTTADRTLSGGTIVAPIVAISNGITTNADAGTSLALSSPISGVNAQSISSLLTGGTDIETDEALRTRMLIQYANPPNGGSKSDYIEWCLAVPGVTRAWCLPNGVGIGTVSLYTMMDLIEAAHGGFPQGTSGGATAENRIAPATLDLLSVADYVFPLRPVTALVYSFAPTPQSIGVTIGNLTPNTAQIRTAISTAITNALTDIADPTGSTLYNSTISTAIESVAGVVSFTLVAPTSPTVIGIGQIPQLSTVTYV